MYAWRSFRIFPMLKRLGPRMNPILGLCFALIVFLTSVFGSYVLSLFIPLLLFNAHKRWRIIADRAIAFWFFIPTVNFFIFYNSFQFFFYFFGVKMGNSVTEWYGILVISSNIIRSFDASQGKFVIEGWIRIWLPIRLKEYL